MSGLLELLEVVSLGMMAILPLANPLTTVALLLGMSGNRSHAELHRLSRMTSIYVFMIMLVAFYGGQIVMTTFGISIPGLRVAGGLIVAYIGFRMLFPVPAPAAGTNQDELSADIAFIPLAMPSTAGPGTIAMIISGAATFKDLTNITPWVLTVAPVLVFIGVSLVLWISLRSAKTIMRFLGRSGIEAVSRLMGFLLICMGVQFVINGIVEITRSI
ncbi:MarC family NAAT transporter [Solimicrobium silvestre]|uniref:UPF0056 membrane protein n=1 Tax=Solimicrobium silvestre TaxID=2099400 RepID=A0A2S9H3W2_9BURK|nr:MarC family NAAT transporter [Solimicrobium silvestre]PRC94675.1 membrane protein, MarC [Solimicrobium silvestre]